MGIVVDAAERFFHLQSAACSYVIGIERGYPVHLYWGKRLRAWNGSAPLHFYDRGFSPNPTAEDRTFSPDSLPLEYSTAHGLDYRPPALRMEHADGGESCQFSYSGYRIVEGKPPLEGLPAVYVENTAEASTLELDFEDDISNLTLTLSYTVFEALPVICRHTKLHNRGKSAISLSALLSAQVDLREDEYELINLWGGHIKEQNIQRLPVPHGTTETGSLRGASSHQFSPFLALCTPQTNEQQGEVYAMSLVYSGNFVARTHRDQFGSVRMQMGIHDADFRWRLEPDERFTAPETVLVYSSEGLGGMSRCYHRLYRSRLARGYWRDRVRPILVNNWEATYFDFSGAQLLEIARKGAQLGAELFVLDDGWFGKRNSDLAALGDWTANEEKLGCTLAELADAVNALGLDFGLWFEPEMVNEDSALYRAHPDWVLKAPRYPAGYGRAQLVLDLSRQDVCAYIIEAVSAVLSAANIRYVKWDMNRHIAQAGSALLPAKRQGEVRHRYMLGLYQILETLTTRFPQVLFEGCSGGGGRFDAGLLHYMPQIWTSDNTDAISRLKIQYGTSLVMPPIATGAHVSAVPNHQLGRSSDLRTRGAVAMSGNLGYELNLARLDETEQMQIQRQITRYKQLRETVQFGDFYRLLSPFEDNDTAWCFVAADGSEVFAVYVRAQAQPAAPVRLLRFAGLDPDASYRSTRTGKSFGGDELMQAGIALPLSLGDGQSVTFHFKREGES